MDAPKCHTASSHAHGELVAKATLVCSNNISIKKSCLPILHANYTYETPMPPPDDSRPSIQPSNHLISNKPSFVLCHLHHPVRAIFFDRTLRRPEPHVLCFGILANLVGSALSGLRMILGPGSHVIMMAVHVPCRS